MIGNVSPIEWAARVPVIVSRDLLETMAAGGPREIDRFLLPQIRQLKDEYQRGGNPHIIYMAGSAVGAIVTSIPSYLHSFQFSRLQALLAEMLIAQGSDAASLHVAEQHLNLALDIIHRVHAVCDDIVRAHVSFALLLSVARKALGKFDDSLEGLGATARYLTQKRSLTELDLIPLRRQEIMMHQTVAGHQQLAEDAMQYRTLRPREYYRSLKRVFEFLLNRGGLREAKQIYPEFKKAFAAIAQQVTPISHVSFLKNVGQYHMARSEAKAAANFFARTMLEGAHPLIL